MIRMALGVSAGRALSGAAVVASLLGACGGQSEFSPGDDSGEAEGGTAPAGGSSSGGSGGAAAIGGVGGIVTSTGGAPACPACPEADYGLVIEGDGAPYTMRYQGAIDALADHEASCPEVPLRGMVGGCGRSIVVSACLGPTSGRPCLEIADASIRYVDRQRGELYTGLLSSDVPSEAAPGVETGTIGVELTSDTGRTLVLTIGYTFCATALGNLRIVC